MKNGSRIVNLILLTFLLIGALLPQGIGLAGHDLQEADPHTKALTLLKKMTAEEKVGQLFLFTFKGSDASEASQIYDLLANYHVGGVVLSSANDNFTGPDQTVQEAYKLIAQLQADKWQSSQAPHRNTTTGRTYTPQYVPLLVGVFQDGDGYPNDQIINGLTTLPDELAIGATWNTDMARQVGSVMGSELKAVGINLLFGPSLDVLENKQPVGGEDLSTRTFGGDPYWVGEMGKAYIEGVHQGAENQIAVIAKHFPGRGDADRSPQEEVATVPKSLDELQQVELVPFFAVTGSAPTADATTDGILVSHIRYQRNIRATTRPVSFDATALGDLLKLPMLSTWRDQGGVVVTDDLGSRAVRRFYDPAEKVFDSRQVARNAFLAGNDLLYADNFVSSGDPDNYTTIIRTLTFFAQKYQEDTDFAAQVDASVERILTMKYRLYPNFDLSLVTPPEDGLAGVGQSQNVTAEVARQSLTLISPDAVELANILPKEPQVRDRILFITDTLQSKQCSRCTEESAMPVDAIQNAVLRFYGSQVGGQVLQSRLFSYSFADLNKLLNDPEGLPALESDLNLSQWVVFSMLNVTQDRSNSGALRQLLSARPDLLRDKHVIVFAFNAPYYLDATDVSKLTAYFGLYSKAPPFIDVAAKVLFQEMSPSGALPVSVVGVGYDLITATSPKKDQVIQVFLDAPEIPTVVPDSLTITPEPTEVPRFRVEDTIPLRTGVILDHNQHPVPDGTVVRFSFISGIENPTTQLVEAVTTNGIARASYRIDQPGLLEIRVSSEPALVSDILRLDITGTESAAITAIAPTLQPTETLQPTPTEEPSPTPTITVEPIRSDSPGINEWLLSIFVILASSGLVYWVSVWLGNSILWGIRASLTTGLGGLTAYSYLATGLPGSSTWIQSTGVMGVVEITFVGIGLGFVVGIIWRNWPVIDQKQNG